VNTSLVGEGTESSNVVVAVHQLLVLRVDRPSLQRDRDLDGLCDQVFDFSEHREVILGLDVFWVGDHHSSNETTKRCDTVSFSNTELEVSF
jgi:hypothetical protein